MLSSAFTKLISSRAGSTSSEDKYGYETNYSTSADETTCNFGFENRGDGARRDSIASYGEPQNLSEMYFLALCFEVFDFRIDNLSNQRLALSGLLFGHLKDAFGRARKYGLTAIQH